MYTVSDLLDLTEVNDRQKESIAKSNTFPAKCNPSVPVDTRKTKRCSEFKLINNEHMRTE